MIIVFGYKSDTEFYYAHVSTDNTIYPHNGIFVVNNADRLRLDDQWSAVMSRGAPPAITDTAWHDVSVTRCADSGEIAVRVDGKLLMTAVDKTFGCRAHRVRLVRQHRTDQELPRHRHGCAGLSPMRRLVIALFCVSLAALSGAVPASASAGAGHHRPGGVFPPLKRDLVVYYDFEHPASGGADRT